MPSESIVVVIRTVVAVVCFGRDDFDYCHWVHVTTFMLGTNISPDRIGVSLLPLEAILRSQWLSVARASHAKYCISSVIVSSCPCAICISVAKHSGVLVMGMRLAGSSVRFFNAEIAAVFSSGSDAWRALRHSAITRPCVLATSCRHGLSCDRFCNAKHANRRVSSFSDESAVTKAGTTIRIWKTMSLELPRCRVRLARILVAWTCDSVSCSWQIWTSVAIRAWFLARVNCANKKKSCGQTIDGFSF